MAFSLTFHWLDASQYVGPLGLPCRRCQARRHRMDPSRTNANLRHGETTDETDNRDPGRNLPAAVGERAGTNGERIREEELQLQRMDEGPVLRGRDRDTSRQDDIPCWRRRRG